MSYRELPPLRRAISDLLQHFASYHPIEIEVQYFDVEKFDGRRRVQRFYNALLCWNLPDDMGGRLWVHANSTAVNNLTEEVRREWLQAVVERARQFPQLQQRVTGAAAGGRLPGQPLRIERVPHRETERS